MAQHEELMKKTETMNVVMETNKMLREEKERLEQDLQQMQAKVWNFLIKSKHMSFLIMLGFLHQMFKKILALFSGKETGVRYFTPTRSKC